MEYIQLTLDDYLKSKTEIRENLGGIVKSFVQIGWQLTRIDRSKAYEMDGYKNIAEFAKAEYDMNPTGVSRFMSVYETYSLDGDTPELKEQYKKFNFSQLTEMLQLEEKDRGIFRPETKREDIREFKAFARENENNPEELLNWKGAKTPEEKLKATILEFFREKEGLLNKIFSSEAYRSGDIRELAELVNPSGGTSYRKGTVFLMLYGPEDQIMVKIFGEEPWKITWEEFFSVMQEIFGDAAAGSRTYENFFGTEDKADKEDKQEAPAVPENQAPDKEDGTAEEKTDQEAGVREDQIPGQDNIMNHPEYMPGIAPAQKTEEQKYNEEQSRIDRETKKKLKEMEDEEKMEHLPSDEGPKIHQIRMPSKYYDDVAAGVMSFWFAKGEFRTGEILNMMEFSEGRHTGRTIRTEITYILDDYTGLEDGYCIMAIKPVKDRKEQPPLPKLKNNDERKEWLKNYKIWPLIHTDPYTGAKYYEYHFDNGAVLVAEVWEKHGDRYLGDYETSYLHLIGGPEPPKGQYGQGKWERHKTFNRYPDNETSLVEFLKEVQKA